MKYVIIIFIVVILFASAMPYDQGPCPTSSFFVGSFDLVYPHGSELFPDSNIVLTSSSVWVNVATADSMRSAVYLYDPSDSDLVLVDTSNHVYQSSTGTDIESSEMTYQIGGTLYADSTYIVFFSCKSGDVAPPSKAAATSSPRSGETASLAASNISARQQLGGFSEYSRYKLDYYHMGWTTAWRSEITLGNYTTTAGVTIRYCASATTAEEEEEPVARTTYQIHNANIQTMQINGD